MAVGMVSWTRSPRANSPSPKAFLVITLAGSFFVDLVNAFIVQGMLKLPIFH